MSICPGLIKGPLTNRRLAETTIKFNYDYFRFSDVQTLEVRISDSHQFLKNEIMQMSAQRERRGGQKSRFSSGSIY